MIELNKIYNDDCLTGMKEIPDKSVDLVLMDPPYNISIKGEKWDKWKTVDDYIAFMGTVLAECERVLKPTGSLYFSHNDLPQIAKIMEHIEENTELRFNSFIVWDKGDFRALSWKNPSEKNNLRSWFNTCEYFLSYTFESKTGLQQVLNNTETFPTLREYFQGLQSYLSLNLKCITKEIGRRAEHAFYWNLSLIHI